MTYRWVFEDLRVLVYGRRVDGHAVVLAHQVHLAVARPEVRVLCDVTDHEDAARQTTRLLHDTVCNTTTRDRACKSSARKRGWGQLGAGRPYSPC